VLRNVLGAGSVVEQAASFPHLLVVGTVELGESPLLGDVNLLTAGELELGSPEGLDDGIPVLVVGPDRHQWLSDVDTGDCSLGLAESSPHSSLQTISACARQHFVDAENVEGMDTDLDVELILGRVLHHVLVATDAASLEGLGGELLVLIGDQVDAEGELVDASLLTAQVEDPDLGVGDTAAEPGLGVGLVLAVAVATRWTPAHLE